MTHLFGIPIDTLTTVLLSVTLVITGVVALLALGNAIFFRIGIRNIPRRRTQMWLIIFALMLSTTLLSSVLATGDVITTAVQTVAVYNLGSVDETIEGGHGALGAFSDGVYYELNDLAKHNPDIAAVGAALVEHDLLVADSTSRQVRSKVTALGIIPNSEQGFGGMQNDNGRGHFTIAALGANEIYLNHTAAVLLNAHPGDSVYLYSKRWPGKRYQVTIAAIVGDSGLVGQSPYILSNIQFFRNIEQRNDDITQVYIANRGGANGVNLSDQVTQSLRRWIPGDVHVIQVKQQGVQNSQKAEDLFSRVFALFSLFALAIGLLLIFLIFVLLAAERRVEMGMARAIGVQRRHLVLMFLFEGSVYDLLASFFGLGLGIALGTLLVVFLGPILARFNFPLKLTLQPRSLVIAYCLGVIFTFCSVAASSWLVSRMTVVEAMRDLPEPGQNRLSLGEVCTRLLALPGMIHKPFKLRRILLEQFPDLLVELLRALIVLGFLPLLAGYWLMQLGLERLQIAFFSLGFSLIVLGGGLLVKAAVGLVWRVVARIWPSDRKSGSELARQGTFPSPPGDASVPTPHLSTPAPTDTAGLGWRMRKGLGQSNRKGGSESGHRRPTGLSSGGRVNVRLLNKIFVTLAGVAIVAYWALPFDVLARFGLPRFQGGIEIFFFAGLMMVLGTAWVLMTNAELLVRPLVALCAGLPGVYILTRLAAAYPLQRRFRTGLSVVMFSLVVFAMTVMAVITNAMQNTYTNIDTQTGGYDIQAVAYFKALPDLRTALLQHGINPNVFSAIGVQTSTAVGVIQLSNTNPSWKLYPARVVDGGFLHGLGLHLLARAQGFSSDDAVWQALQTHPNYALIDNDALPYRPDSIFSSPVYDPNAPLPADAGMPTQPPGFNSPYTFSISGVYQGDSSFSATPVWVTGLQSPSTDNAVTQIPEAATPAVKLTIIGVVDNSDSAHFGLYIPQAAYSAKSDSNAQTPDAQTYYFKVAPGQDKRALALALGSAFLDNGLETTVLEDAIWQLRGPRIFLSDVLLGVVGLTLLLGVTALAITGTRAVIERRQQIGMLRVIGCKRGLIQAAFLCESFFVGTFGSLLGVVLGLVLARNIFVTNFFEQFHTGLIFSVPWQELGLIVGIALLASFLGALLPAWQAGRISPAEAIRYV
jgi:ABC-type antimicrobial peptide transport system permease subunit